MVKKIEYMPREVFDELYAELLTQEVRWVTASANLDAIRAASLTPSEEEVTKFTHQIASSYKEVIRLHSLIWGATLQPVELIGLDEHSTAEALEGRRMALYQRFEKREGIAREVVRKLENEKSVTLRQEYTRSNSELTFVLDMKRRVNEAYRELLIRRRNLPWWKRWKF